MAVSSIMLRQAISLASFIENQSDVPQSRSDFRCVGNELGGVMPEENAAYCSTASDSQSGVDCDGFLS